jgi:hypothetical protein
VEKIYSFNELDIFSIYSNVYLNFHSFYRVAGRKMLDPFSLLLT